MLEGPDWFPWRSSGLGHIDFLLAIAATSTYHQMKSNNAKGAMLAWDLSYQVANTCHHQKNVRASYAMTLDSFANHKADSLAFCLCVCVLRTAYL